jgi:hypothetical protein
MEVKNRLHVPVASPLRRKPPFTIQREGWMVDEATKRKILAPVGN